MNKKIIILIVFALSFVFCGTYLPEYKTAEEYYVMGKYVKAYKLYKEALEKDPLNREYRLGYIKAKTAIINGYMQMVKYYINSNEITEAKKILKKAIIIAPEELYFKTTLKTLSRKEKKENINNKRKTEAIKKTIKTELINIKFKDSPVSEIIKSIAKYGKLNVVFDQGFKDSIYSIELNNKKWEDALNIVCQATKLFFVKLDSNTIIISPDNLMNRSKYKKDQIKTFYLYEANGKKLIQTLSRITRGRVIINYFQDINAIIARGSPQELNFLGELVKRLDKPKEQVMIEINIMEASENILNDLGLNTFSEGGLGITLFPSSSDDGKITGNGFNLNQISKISSSDIYLTVPASIIKMLQRSGWTKTLANPTIVGMEGEKLTFKIGEKFPLPNSQWQPMAAGGFASQPVTNFEYKDIGLNFTVTPSIHRGGEVSLKIKIEVSSLGATGYANIPSIRNREIEVNLRLKEGETNILAGLLQEEEKKTIAGILGLSKIPIIGKLFGTTHKTYNQTDIIFTITPHIIKKMDITEEDEKPIEIKKNDSLTISRRRFSPDSFRKSFNRRTDDNKNRLFIPNKLYMVKGNPYTLILSGKIDSPAKKANIALSYDPKKLEVISVDKANNKAFTSFDNSSGTINIGIEFQGKKGFINLGSIKFKPKSNGESSIEINNLSITDNNGKLIELSYPSDIKIIIRK
jgi:general secretion pathway protein D